MSNTVANEDGGECPVCPICKAQKECPMCEKCEVCKAKASSSSSEPQQVLIGASPREQLDSCKRHLSRKEDELNEERSGCEGRSEGLVHRIEQLEEALSEKET